MARKVFLGLWLKIAVHPCYDVQQIGLLDLQIRRQSFILEVLA
jgi:hypothetical protein